jgi:hypothetical protein
MERNRMEHNRTVVRLVGAVLLFALATGPILAAGAPDRLEEPRQTAGQPGVHVTTLPTDVMALGIGKPTRLALVESWVSPYQDEETLGGPDTYLTRPFWWDDELLSIFVAYSIVNPEIGYTLSVQIKDSRNVPVFSYEGTFAPGQAGLLLTSVVVTPGPPASPPSALPAGAYHVTVKIKQRDTSVGQRYWLIVFSRG